MATAAGIPYAKILQGIQGSPMQFLRQLQGFFAVMPKAQLAPVSIPHRKILHQIQGSWVQFLRQLKALCVVILKGQLARESRVNRVQEERLSPRNLPPFAVTGVLQ